MRWFGMCRFAVTMACVCAATASAAANAAPPGDDGVCLDEGKDPVCGHYAATVARLLAADEHPALTAEADADTDVTHCFLDVELDPAAKTIAGTNTLTVTSLTAGLTTFTLDLRDNMTVDAVAVAGSPAPYTRPTHAIEITLDRPYDAGESFAVAVTYHGVPQDVGYGSFDWNVHNGTQIASTLSEPFYAHTWWPCKDSLGDKFTTDVWITVPDWMVVASNGLLQGTDAVAGGKLRYRWHESYPIVTYLVSLAATNYVTWSQDYTHANGTMPVVFFAYPESQGSMQAGVADLLTQIQTFSRADVYGEYPFVNEKYGIAQFPWAGGIEHQTLTSQGAFASWLNAHELAHQWWGDMVTCGTWHDIWLNEGFASFSEALYQEKKPGGSLAAYHTRMSERRPTDLSGSVYVYDTSSLGAIFSGNNVYNKGAWAVHMLRHVLGNTTFFEVLHDYRAAFEGGSAITEDFKAVAEATSGRDLAWYFDEWIYGSGAPSYRYGWQSAHLGTQWYLRVHVLQLQTPVFTMPIDLTVTTGNGMITTPIWNDAALEWYVLPIPASPTNVQFDKDNWVLRQTTSLVGYVAGPPKLVTLAPPPGALLPTAPQTTTIMLGFSDGIAYSPEDFSVVGARTGAHPAAINYDADDFVVTLDPGALPTADTYTVTLADGIQSIAAGKALDGELGAPVTLPSGDGQPGGSAIYSFTIASSADFDVDGDVDVADFTFFQACFNGPGSPPASVGNCDLVDLDDDGDVDVGDFLLFQACFNGAAALPAVSCAG